MPRLERFKGMLNNDFLRLFPGTEGLEFDYDNPRPQNAEAINAERASKTTAFSTLVLAGVAPADAANVVGLPPLAMNRSEERCVGKEWVRTCRAGWSQYHKKKKT